MEADEGWVYPHARGETFGRETQRAVVGGLSPRTWGNRRRRSNHRLHGGSIPTHVGKPCRWGGCTPPYGVYPHARGETAHKGLEVVNEGGLSPRTWGNLGRGACS